MGRSEVTADHAAVGTAAGATLASLGSGRNEEQEAVERLVREKVMLEERLEANAAQWQREKRELQDTVGRLENSHEQLQARLEFVEELLGPTEAQRKVFQLQINAARQAALRARHCGAVIPTRFMGRLDESWLHMRGLTDKDCALLQHGCITGQDSVPHDVSLLGDPSFTPYDRATLKPVWDARGGTMGISLGDVRTRWGEDVALEVVRCAIELDQHDSSRRLGVELPWSSQEDRELQPAEIIAMLDRELLRQEQGLDSSRSTPTTESSQQPEAFDVLPRGEGVYSPAWSAVESVGTTAPQVAPPAPQQYEWSLADADIEQLLRREPPTAGGCGPSPLNSGGASPTGVPAGGLVRRNTINTLSFSDVVEEDAEEEADIQSTSVGVEALFESGMALLELLEEEVIGPLGQLSNPNSPRNLRRYSSTEDGLD